MCFWSILVYKDWFEFFDIKMEVEINKGMDLVIGMKFVNKVGSILF